MSLAKPISKSLYERGMKEVGGCVCCEAVLAEALVWLHLLDSLKDVWALVNSFSYSTGVP